MRKTIALLPCVAAVAACGPESPFGFRLPDGDAAAGREAFVDLGCNACHEVAGVPIEYLEGVAHVQLGGKTTHLRTYGELVTSIINPSHKIYPGIDRKLVQTNNVSRMNDFSEVMTVRQLCDLVAFLETLHR